VKVFDAYASYYDLLYRDKDYAGESRYVLDLLAQQGIPGGQLLELGCGTGRHAEHFGSAGFRVHGIDLSEKMVARAEERMSASAAGHRNADRERDTVPATRRGDRGRSPR